MADQILRIIILGDSAGATKAFAETSVAADATAADMGLSMEGATSKVGGLLTRLGTSASNMGIPFAGALTNVGQKFDEADTKGEKLASGMSTLGGVTLLAAGAGFAAVAAESIHLADGFDQATSKIAASAGIPEAAAKKISDSFLSSTGVGIDSGTALANAYAGNAAQLDNLEGHVLTATQAHGFMATAENTSAASGENLSSVTSGLAATLEAYHQKVGQAGSDADILYNTGKLTGLGFSGAESAVTKLKSKLGDLAPSLGETGGLIDDLTEHGETGRAALTGVASGLQFLISTANAAPKAGKAVSQATQDAVTNATASLKSVEDSIAASRSTTSASAATSLAAAEQKLADIRQQLAGVTSPTIVQQQNLANAQEAVTAASAKAASAGQLTAIQQDQLSAATTKLQQAKSNLSAAEAASVPTLTTSAAALKATGIEAFDSSGHFVGMDSVITQLQPKLAGLTQQQQLQTLAAVFGKTANKTLLDTVLAGPAAFDKATASVEKHGSVLTAAQRSTDDLHGQEEKLKTTVEDLGTKFGETLIPKLEDGAKALEGTVVWFEKNKEVAEVLAGVVGGVLSVAVATFTYGKLADLAKNVKGIISDVSSLGGKLANLVLPGNSSGGAGTGGETGTAGEAGTAGAPGQEGTITVDAADAATQLEDAITTGGDAAAASIRDALATGGTTAGTEISGAEDAAATAAGATLGAGEEAGATASAATLATGEETGATAAAGELSLGEAEGGATAGGEITLGEATGGAEAATEITAGELTGGGEAGTAIALDEATGGAAAGRELTLAEAVGGSTAGGELTLAETTGGAEAASEIKLAEIEGGAASGGENATATALESGAGAAGTQAAIDRSLAKIAARRSATTAAGDSAATSVAEGTAAAGASTAEDATAAAVFLALSPKNPLILPLATGGDNITGGPNYSKQVGQQAAADLPYFEQAAGITKNPTGAGGRDANRLLNLLSNVEERKGQFSGDAKNDPEAAAISQLISQQLSGLGKGAGVAAETADQKAAASDQSKAAGELRLASGATGAAAQAHLKAAGYWTTEAAHQDAAVEALKTVNFKSAADSVSKGGEEGGKAQKAGAEGFLNVFGPVAPKWASTAAAGEKAAEDQSKAATLQGNAQRDFNAGNKDLKDAGSETGKAAQSSLAAANQHFAAASKEIGAADQLAPGAKLIGDGASATVDASADHKAAAAVHKTAADTHGASAKSHGEAATSHKDAASKHSDAADSHKTAAAAHLTASHSQSTAASDTSDAASRTKTGADSLSTASGKQNDASDKLGNSASGLGTSASGLSDSGNLLKGSALDLVNAANNFSTNVHVNVAAPKVNVTVNQPAAPASPATGLQASLEAIGFATGGLIDSPTLAVIGEAGDREGVITEADPTGAMRIFATLFPNAAEMWLQGAKAGDLPGVKFFASGSGGESTQQIQTDEALKNAEAHGVDVTQASGLSVAQLNQLTASAEGATAAGVPIPSGPVTASTYEQINQAVLGSSGNPPATAAPVPVGGAIQGGSITSSLGGSLSGAGTDASTSAFATEIQLITADLGHLETSLSAISIDGVGGADAGGDTTIIFQVGDREVAKAILPALSSVALRRGRATVAGTVVQV